ncbi:glycosyltransferase family 39 protein [Micromonosporaceae bacterium Da 78-11]
MPAVAPVESPTTEQPIDASARRRGRSTPVWVVPALATAVISLVRIGRPTLWRDELATLIAADRSFGDQIRLESGVDAVLGMYYAVMHVWIELFGTSAFALRLPSVIAVTVAAGLVAAIGARLFDRRIGLLAGLLFALIPAVSRYGQEARPYAGVLTATLLATLLLLRALEQPRWPRWVAYAGSVLLVGAVHIFALDVLLAHGTYVGYLLWSGRRRPWMTWLRHSSLAAWLVSVTVALMVLAPLIVLAGRQRGQVDWIPPLDWDLALRWHEDLFLDGSVAAVIIVLALLSVRRSVPASVLCGALAVLPVLALAAASLTVAPLWVLRYILFTVPGWVILAGATLARFGRTEMVAGLTAVLVFGLPSQSAMRSDNGHGEIDYRTLAKIVDTNGDPGDALFYPRQGRFREGVAYYRTATDLRIDDVLATSTAAAAGSLEVPECAEPRRCIGRAVRVWVFCAGDCSADPSAGLDGPKRDVLTEEGFELRQTWRVYRATVAVYQR